MNQPILSTEITGITEGNTTTSSSNAAVAPVITITNAATSSSSSYNDDIPIRRTSVLETVYEELQEKAAISSLASTMVPIPMDNNLPSPSFVSSSSSPLPVTTPLRIYDNFIPVVPRTTNIPSSPSSINKPNSNNFNPSMDKSTVVSLDDNDGNLIIHIGDTFLSTRYPTLQYVVEDIQGIGSFGTVVKARIHLVPNISNDSKEISKLPSEEEEEEHLPSYLYPGSLVAVKIVRNHPVYRSQASLEIHLLTLLSKTTGNTLSSTTDNNDHPASPMGSNIVRLYDHYTAAGGHLCIVFEYLPTTIFDLLQKSGFIGLSLRFIKVILIQLLITVHKLHVQGLIHSDIKPENIMLNGNNIQKLLTVPESFQPVAKDTSTSSSSATTVPSTLPVSSASPPPVQLLSSGPAQLYHKYITSLPSEVYTAPTAVVVKLIDFGSAGYEHTNCYHYVQSRFYRAPEVMFGCTYDGSADIWSIGCVIAELFFGLPLFPGCDELDCVRRIFTLLGWAPEYMIIGGSQAHRFFTEDTPGTLTTDSSMVSSPTGTTIITDPIIQDVVQAVSATIESSVKDKDKTENVYGRPRHGAFAEPSLDDLDLVPLDDGNETNITKTTTTINTLASKETTTVENSLLLKNFPSFSTTVSCRSKLSIPSRTLRFVQPHRFAQLTGKSIGVPKYYYASNCLEQLVIEYDDRQGFIPNLYSNQQTIILQQIQEYRQQLENGVSSGTSTSSRKDNGTNTKHKFTPSTPVDNTKNGSQNYSKQVTLPYNLDTNEIQERKLFADLLHSLLSIDPRVRPTAAQALNHPFFHSEKEISKLYLSKNTLTALGQEDEQYIKPRRQKTIDINTQAYNHACVRSGIGIHHLRQSTVTTNERSVAFVPSSPPVSTVYRSPEYVSTSVVPISNEYSHPSLNDTSSNMSTNGFWWLSPEQQQHIYHSMPWLFPSFNSSNSNNEIPTYYDPNNSTNVYSHMNHNYYGTMNTQSSNESILSVPGYTLSHSQSHHPQQQRGHSYSMSAINSNYSPVLHGRGRNVNTNININKNNNYYSYTNNPSPDYTVLPPPPNSTNNDNRSRGTSNISDYYLPFSPSNNPNNSISEATGGYYYGEGLRMSTDIKEGYISLGRSISGEVLLSSSSSTSIPIHGANYPTSVPAPAPPPPSNISSVRNSPYPSYSLPSQQTYQQQQQQQRSRAPSTYSIGYTNDSPSMYPPPLPSNSSPYSVNGGYSPLPLLPSNDQPYGSYHQSPPLHLPPSVASIARGSPSASFSLDSPAIFMPALSLPASNENTVYSTNNSGRSSNANGYTYAASANNNINNSNGRYRSGSGGNGSTYRHRSGSGRSTEGPSSPLTNNTNNNYGFFPVNGMNHRSSFHSSRNNNPSSYSTTSRSSFSSVNGNPINFNSTTTNINTGTNGNYSNSNSNSSSSTTSTNTNNNVSTYYGGRTITPEPHNATTSNDSWLSPSTTHRTSLSYGNPTNNNDDPVGSYNSGTVTTAMNPSIMGITANDNTSVIENSPLSRKWSIDSRPRAWSTSNSTNGGNASTNGMHTTGNNGASINNLPSSPPQHHPQIFHQKAYHPNGLPIHNHTRHIYQNITGNNSNKNYYYNIQNIRNQISKNHPNNHQHHHHHHSPPHTIRSPSFHSSSLVPENNINSNTNGNLPSSPPSTNTVPPYVYGGANVTMGSANIPPARKSSQSLPLNLYK